MIHKQLDVAVVAKQLTDLNDFSLNVATHKTLVVMPRPINLQHISRPNS